MSRSVDLDQVVRPFVLEHTCHECGDGTKMLPPVSLWRCSKNPNEHQMVGPGIADEIRERMKPCPTCPPPTLMSAPPDAMNTWSTFGPCGDGRYHDTTCPVAREAMRAAKWPCGKPRYPELL